MRDSLGNKLGLGDVLTYASQLDSHVRLGRVIKFTPQFIVIRDITQRSTTAGYKPHEWEINRRKPESLTLVSNQMSYLEDGEVYLHFQRLREDQS